MVLGTVLDAILLLAGGVALLRKYWPLVFKGLLSSTTAVTVITTHTASTLSAERFFP